MERNRRRMRARGPVLAGFRVVTLGGNIPAPAAAARLVDLGASVVKIESPAGDPMAAIAPDLYRELNRGQKIVALSLKVKADRARVDALLAKSDLLLTASRPASLRKLWLDWKPLHKRFPRLCHVALVGHSAPHQNRPGHDMTYLAETGLIEPPNLPLSLWPDLATVERLVAAAFELLFARERTGKSGWREIAIEDTAKFLTLPLRHGLTVRGGLLGGGSPRYNLYRAKDGWIALAALEPHFWARLKRELRLKTGSKRELLSAFRKRSADAWARWAEARDIPLAPLRNSGDRARPVTRSFRVLA